MISPATYTAEQIDLLYAVVETTAERPINLWEIDEIVQPGDFYLVGHAANGLVFRFDGLTWIKDGIIYDALLQPCTYSKEIIPLWRTVITRAVDLKILDDCREVADVEEYFRKYDNPRACLGSSGDLSMIRKENRAYQFQK